MNKNIKPLKLLKHNRV